MVGRGRGRDPDGSDRFAMLEEGAGDAVVHGQAGAVKRGDRLAWVRRYLTGDGLRPAERALQWSVAFNFLLIVVHIQSFAAWNALLPLKRDVPVLYEVRGYDRAVVGIKTLQMQGEWLSVVLESEAVRYVKVRHEVVGDLDEMARRWSPKCAEKFDPVGYEDSDLLCSYMAFHSSEPEYRRFLENEVKPVKSFVDEGYSRQVKILQDPIRRGDMTDDETGARLVTYEVRFVLKDFRKRKLREGAALPGDPELVRERNMSSLVTFRQDGPIREVRHRHLNPFGLVAVKYVPNEFQDFSEKRDRR